MLSSPAVPTMTSSPGVPRMVVVFPTMVAVRPLQVGPTGSSPATCVSSSARAASYACWERDESYIAPMRPPGLPYGPSAPV